LCLFKKFTLNKKSYWSWVATTNRVFIHLYNRSNFASGTNNHHFIHAGQFRCRNSFLNQWNIVGCANFTDHNFSDTGQNQVRIGMGVNRNVFHAYKTGMRAFGNNSVANKNGFDGILFTSFFGGKHVGQQRNRFDVATQPANILGSDNLHSIFELIPL